LGVEEEAEQQEGNEDVEFAKLQEPSQRFAGLRSLAAGAVAIALHHRRVEENTNWYFRSSSDVDCIERPAAFCGRHCMDRLASNAAGRRMIPGQVGWKRKASVKRPARHVITAAEKVDNQVKRTHFDGFDPLIVGPNDENQPIPAFSGRHLTGGRCNC
jgi:hypothetical protein